jgi:calmodulin
MAEVAVSNEEALEGFKIYDKKNEGKIEGKDIPNLLRALGQNPTEAELNKLFEGKWNQKFTFDQYVAIQNRPDGWKQHGTQAEFVQAFQVFDRNESGLISGGELRYVLTSLGEKLTDRQVDELLRVVEVDKEGMVNYEEFVKAIVNG